MSAPSAPALISDLEHAIERDADVEAMFTLATIFRCGTEHVEKDISRAAALFQRAINEGAHAGSMNSLAALFEDGFDGVHKDIGKAVRLYQRAVDEAAHVPAMYNLALLLHSEVDGLEKDVLRAVELYQRAVDEGANVDAMINLASLLIRGAEGVAKDARRVVALLERAVEEHSSGIAMLNLAAVLSSGDEAVEKDAQRAVELYQRAAEEGDYLSAMDNFAALLLGCPAGVDQSVYRAVDLYRIAVDKGGLLLHAINTISQVCNGVNCFGRDLDLLYVLGACSEIGSEGLEKYARRAAALYQSAVDSGGHVEAMFNLAQLLYDGADGVEKDVRRAATLFQRAADEGGHVKSMHVLGFILENGDEGVERDIEQAVTLYQRAVDEGGHADAMFNLAVLLSNDVEGVEQDIRRAIQLYQRAIDSCGHVRAMNNLGTLLISEARGAENVARAVALLKRAVDEGNHVGAMFNLAQLLRKGDEGVARDIPGAIRLFQRGIDLEHRPSHMVILARLLLSEDAGSLRDPARAKALLERAVSDTDSATAMHELAVLLWRGDAAVPRDPDKARNLYDDAKIRGRFNVDTVRSSPLEKWCVDSRERFHIVVEKVLGSLTVKPRQCFLLTLGGAGRGKTSVVRSLKGMSFVEEHIPTELACLKRLRVVPGGRHLSEEEVAELVFNSESLKANLSRVKPGMVTRRMPEILISESVKAEMEDGEARAELPDMEIVQLSESLKAYRVLLDKGITDAPSQLESQIYEALANHRPRQSGDIPISSDQDFVEVIENARLSLVDNPFPTVDRGALVQCWDLGGQTHYSMAHALFLRFAAVLVFVVDLERLTEVETRDDEVRELCRWMQLGHALSLENVRPIIVGTRKATCGSVDTAWEILLRGLRHELGEAAYDAWVKLEQTAGFGFKRKLCFVAIENRNAVEDPWASGVVELERIVEGVANETVDARDEIPAVWLAFIEYLEKARVLFLTKEDVVRRAEKFSIFESEMGETEALRALRYYRGLGRLVLFEVANDEYYVFMDPLKIVEFVRQVTGPQELVRQRLGKRHALMLEKGLLTHEGLAVLWNGHAQEVRSVMLNLLCRFDLLMRIQGGQTRCGPAEELIGVPALLPCGWEGFRWALKAGQSELRVTTRFDDALPLGLTGSLIAHLHRTVGEGRTEAGLLRSNAALLSLKDGDRVVVAFFGERRLLVWTVRAKDPVAIAHNCVKSLDEFLDGPLRCARVRRHHSIVADCQSEPRGCGGTRSVEFVLPMEWVRRQGYVQLANLEGKCLGRECDEPWELFDLLPSLVPTAFLGRLPPIGTPSAPTYGPVLLGEAAVPYDLFISHAGTEKDSVAYPLRGALRSERMKCFLDEEELQASRRTTAEQLHAAIRGSKAAVFILSPNFASRKWPMAELRQFLELHDAARRVGQEGPLLFPLFYQLEVDDCKDEQLPYRDRQVQVFRENGFFEESRQRQCSTREAMDALKKLSGFVGLRNDRGESAADFARRAAEHIKQNYLLR